MINKKDIAICFVANQAYLPHFSVALISFIENNADPYEIFLFNEDVDEESFNKLVELLNNKVSEARLHDVKLDTSRLSHFTGYWEKLGKQVYHRLLIADLLPNQFKYALYLDSDIVVNGSFNWEEFPSEGFPVAAVKDNISHILAPKRGLKNYFNAGVMWLNLPLWQEMKAVDKLLTHKPKITRFAEQELLNEVFANNWFELSPKYNYAAHHLTNNKLLKNGQIPVVIHYVGPIKPWLYWVRGSKLYWHYLSLTPYAKGVSSKSITVWNSIKHLWKSRVLK